MFKNITCLKNFSKVKYLVNEDGIIKDYLGNIIRPHLRSTNSKHSFVILHDSTGKPCKVRIDYIVYNTFIGPHDIHICHFDNNPMNNKLSNLKSYYTILKEYGFVPVNNYKEIVSNTYFVNKKGQVFSLNSESGIKFKEDKDGYYTMTIATTNPLRSQVTIRVHNMILTTFKGPAPLDMINPVVDHIDHDIHNNNIENLRWLENEENLKYKYNQGFRKGMNSFSAKLNDKLVEEIKKFPSTVSAKEINEKMNLNMNVSTIQKIRIGKIWSHIRPDLNIDPSVFVHQNRKLSDDTVRTIRKIRKETGMSAAKIKDYLHLDINKDSMKRIINGTYYKDVI